MRLLLNAVNRLVLVVLLLCIVTTSYTIANEAKGHGGQVSVADKHENDDKSLIEKEVRRHFHNTESGLINPAPPIEGYSKGKSFCIYCHGSFPHINNRVVRAMFNFHKTFIACETCHYKERLNKDKVGYRWYDGSPRTIRELKILEDALPKGEIGLTKKLSDKDIYKKYGFTIAPYVKNGDNFVMMVALMEDPVPQEFLSVQGKLSPDQQARYKAKIHGSIDPLGSDCIDCHKQDSQLPFKTLGFTEARIKDLLQTEAAGLFKYYSREAKYKGMTFKIRRLSGIWGIDFNKK